MRRYENFPRPNYLKRRKSRLEHSLRPRHRDAACPLAGAQNRGQTKRMLCCREISCLDSGLALDFRDGGGLRDARDRRRLSIVSRDTSNSCYLPPAEPVRSRSLTSCIEGDGMGRGACGPCRKR